MFYSIILFVTEDGHLAYLYSFGVYENHSHTVRHTLDSIASCSQKEIVVKPNALTISPWWQEDSKKRLQKWPSKPKELIYEQIHANTDMAPWYTYMLVHPNTVPASALTTKDNPRFN